MGRYPSLFELNAIQNWSYKDLKGLMDFVGSIWAYAERGFQKRGNTYKLSTSGWSGNEEIIRALADNQMFWSLCWYQSRIGGHYIFKVPKVKK